MKLQQALDVLEQIAPTRLAQSWDNVGLLVGDPAQDVSAAILTIDYTPAVASEAVEKGCDLIVAYHPPIFQPLRRLAAPSPVFDAIRRGVAIYSPHTALDAAPGGTNDVLADALGLSDRQPLRSTSTGAMHYKLVTFVPADAVEKVSAAIFAAGAGQIGNYSSCSFRIAGTGTFFGQQGTSPAVGQAGRLERVEEIRLETIVPVGAVEAVVRALKQSHPYEEPAFDLNMLASPPTGLGMGRIGIMPPTPRPVIFERIRCQLEIDHLLIAGPIEGQITRAAVCAGAGGEYLDDAISQKAELYLTGEIRHHDALRTAREGMTVVCTLHSNSERIAMKRLATEISRRLPGLKLHLSQQDRDPFVVV